MSIYLFGLILGLGGMVGMAIGGVRHGGRGGGPTHAGGGSGGHGGAGGHGHMPHLPHLPGSAKASGTSLLMSIASPRVLFGFSLGFGAFGNALQHRLPGLIVAVAAVTGGIALERLVINPVWNLAFRFASEPARTLESCVSEEATAVTSFDASGHGIIAVEMDGQVVQVLGSLQQSDRELGVKVRAGERVRIEGIDAARNRATVSLV